MCLSDALEVLVTKLFLDELKFSSFVMGSNMGYWHTFSSKISHHDMHPEILDLEAPDKFNTVYKWYTVIIFIELQVSLADSVPIHTHKLMLFGLAFWFMSPCVKKKQSMTVLKWIWSVILSGDSPEIVSSPVGYLLTINLQCMAPKRTEFFFSSHWYSIFPCDSTGRGKILCQKKRHSRGCDMHCTMYPINWQT